MKKIILTSIILSSFMVSDCSLQTIQADIQQKAEQAMRWVMQKDAEQEQGFSVTSTMLEEKLYKEEGYLDLSKLGLTAIPEICKLMKPEDLTIIQIVNLAQNKIRIVDQDLSCLKNLRVLNLSYNDIQDVVKLGSLPALQELLLHKNNIENIEKLIGMDLPALEKLNLAYNKIKEIKSLGNLKDLIVLELQHNVIESLVGVENLKKLQDLKLEFNKLSDLPFLDTLQQLKSLTTEGNAFKEGWEEKIKSWKQKFTGGQQ